MTKASETGLDILGVKPVAKSIDRVTEAVVDGARAFLGRICLPAAEEFGLALRDQVEAWRTRNKVLLAARAEEKLKSHGGPADVKATPRLVFNILEEGSWVEDAVLQDMWAGLLSSSCAPSGDDDSNLIFVNLMSAITKLQARVLRFAVENAGKGIAPNGLIMSEHLSVSHDRLVEVVEDRDLDRLDRELDHLRELGLIHGGFETGSFLHPEVTPTPLALHMYVRCQGSRSNPADYFGLVLPSKTEQPPA